MSVAPATVPGTPASEDPRLSALLSSTRSPLPEADRSETTPPSALDPPARDALLERLRDRAKALPPTRVAEILATPRSPS